MPLERHSWQPLCRVGPGLWHSRARGARVPLPPCYRISRAGFVDAAASLSVPRARTWIAGTSRPGWLLPAENAVAFDPGSERYRIRREALPNRPFPSPSAGAKVPVYDLLALRSDRLQSLQST
jgi:hypothetical protein